MIPCSPSIILLFLNADDVFRYTGKKEKDHMNKTVKTTYKAVAYGNMIGLGQHIVMSINKYFFVR